MNHKERFEKLVSSVEGYELKSEYNKSSEKVIMHHELCGNTYKVTPNKFQQGRRCPRCAVRKRSKKRRLTHEEFFERFNESSNGEYELLSRYTKQKDKIKVKHKLCGSVYEVYPTNFIHHKNRCMNGPCVTERRSASQRWTQERFEEEVFSLVGYEYKVLGEYRNFLTPVKIRHNKCSNIYNALPGNFIHQNKRCPKCISSKGEEKVEKVLVDAKVPHEREKRFSDCVYKRPLPFDFYGEYKGVSFCIEYDGEFHYHKKFRTEEEFEKQKVRDRIKDDYCKVNNIPLLRIPYFYKGNIKDIVLDFLKEITLSRADQ